MEPKIDTATTLSELERLAREVRAARLDYDVNAEALAGARLADAVLAYVAADRDSRLAGQVAARERAERAIERITAESSRG